MNSKRLVFIPVAAGAVLLDQLGKLHATRTLEAGERSPLLGDVLALAHVPAASGAFGIFRELTPQAQLIGFALLSIVSIAVIVLFYRGLAPRELGNAAALGAVLGGIASNTLDRLRYGFGIDFLHLGPIDAEGMPDFNLADVSIVMGVVTLIVELLATEMAARASERPRS